jgi:hypothetical protein
VTDQADALYALPLDEFTAARNELAKTQPEVKSLKKPARAAWTVNQLARTRRKDVEALIDAGRKLRTAQAEGGDFAAAMKAEREALRPLLDAARGLGATTNAILDRVRDTLQAAAADDEAAEQVLAGRLEHELDAPGFDPLLAAAAAAPRKPRAAAKPAPAADRKREQEHRKRVAEAEAQLRDAERTERRTHAEWERAQREVERARAVLERVTR